MYMDDFKEDLVKMKRKGVKAIIFIICTLRFPKNPPFQKVMVSMPLNGVQ